MLSIQTKYFGTLPYSERSVFDFPRGLPAFEEEKTFVLIESRERAPLVFLQSMTQAGLCFAALPMQAMDKHYLLAIAPEDLEALGLEEGRQPVPGTEVTLLALVSLRDEFRATANLMAPVVLSLKSRRGLQAIRRDSRYSHEHPLTPPAAEGGSEKTC